MSNYNYKNFKTVEDLFLIRKGKKVQKDETGEFNYINIENIHSQSYSDKTNDNGVEVKENDLIIAWDGANAGIVGVGFNGVLGSTLARLRIKKNFVDKVSAKYLYRFLSFKEEYLKSKRTGATIPHVNGDVLKKLQIPLPNLETQKAIAAKLDAADALRQKDQELLEQYNLLAQSIFIEMFGDPVLNEKGWDTDPIIQYADCIVPGRDKPKSFTGDIPWVTTNDLNHLAGTKKSKEGIGLSKKEIESVRARVIPENSILITCVGDLGVVSYAEKEMVVNQQLHSYQLGESLDKYYVMFDLSYRKNYMYKMASTTTVPYMNKTVCNSIPINLPPKLLQTQFAEKIKNIEAQKALVQQQAAQSERLFQALLQESFAMETS